MSGRVAVLNDRVVTKVFYVGETATDATGNVTVAVEDANGASLAGGTIGANNGATGAYDFTLTAATHTAALGKLKITWTATVATLAVQDIQYMEAVGARYFPRVQLRDMRGVNDPVRYLTADLEWARDVAEEFFDQYLETSYVERVSTETYDGDGSTSLFVGRLPARSIVSATIDGVAATITGWTITSSGWLRTDGDIFTSAIAGQNIVITYTWGRTDGVPSDLSRAALRFARHVLLTEETTIPDRARMLQTEIGLFHLDTANEKQPTGLPEVDSVLTRYRHESPASFA